MAENQPVAIDPSLNPLTQKELTLLTEAKDKMTNVIKVIEAAEQCGTDCQQWRSLLEMLSARIDAMEKTYFSTPPMK
tara:strand:+ start:744 stop:974 length:231 start_codon:yes stop_codon:yes gene_type:complete